MKMMYPGRSRLQRLGITVGGALLIGAGSINACPSATADDVGYLINTLTRPGYNFPNGAAALDYGHGICDKVAGGRAFPSVIADVRADLNTADDFQATYLVSQAVDELCPAQIWQLRRSAAGYQPPPGVNP